MMLVTSVPVPIFKYHTAGITRHRGSSAVSYALEKKLLLVQRTQF